MAGLTSQCRVNRTISKGTFKHIKDQSFSVGDIVPRELVVEVVRDLRKKIKIKHQGKTRYQKHYTSAEKTLKSEPLVYQITSEYRKVDAGSLVVISS